MYVAPKKVVRGADREGHSVNKSQKKGKLQKIEVLFDHDPVGWFRAKDIFLGVTARGPKAFDVEPHQRLLSPVL